MVNINVRDTYPFILLCCLVVRAENDTSQINSTSVYLVHFTLEQDMIVIHGIRNVTKASDLECCVACMVDDDCESVSYNGGNKTCQLNDRNPYDDETATNTSSLGWTTFYQKPKCRRGWSFYNGSCYKAVKLLQNWNTSESHCQDLGGHLVDIQNAEEGRFVGDLANITAPGFSFWIGLNDRNEEGTLVWSSSASNQFQQHLPRNTNSNDCVKYITDGNDWSIDGCKTTEYSMCKAGK